jgi:hypothetical protein
MRGIDFKSLPPASWREECMSEHASTVSQHSYLQVSEPGAVPSRATPYLRPCHPEDLYIVPEGVQVGRFAMDPITKCIN